MAQIDDVIEDIQKKLTWLNWRDETHFTMRIDEVTSMLKQTLAVAQGEGPVTTMYDLGITATNCSVTCSVIVDDTETMVEQGFGVLPEGSTFYMVVEPDQDYALESISVNGNYYDITDDIMTIVLENIQDNIEVVATASEATPPEPADLTVSYEDCTVVCKVNGETVSEGEGVLTIGQQLTVTVTPTQDYEVYELNINGVNYKDDMVEGSVTVTVDQDMVISVTCYDPSVTYSISNISTDANILSVTATNQTTGQSVNLTNIPFGTPLTIAIAVTSGYVVDTLEINQESITVTPEETVDDTFHYYGFIVGITSTEALTEINATASQVTPPEPADLWFYHGTGVTSAEILKNGEPAETLNVGDFVDLEITWDTGYTLKKIVINNGGNLTTTSYDDASGSITLTNIEILGTEVEVGITVTNGHNDLVMTVNGEDMPVSQPNATFSFEQNNVSFTPTFVSGSANGALTYGDSLSLVVLPDAGYVIENLLYSTDHVTWTSYVSGNPITINGDVSFEIEISLDE